MSELMLVRDGHGYEISDRGRCTAFDGIRILANPLGGHDNASRESRVFRRADGGTCYGAYVISLGEWESRCSSDLLLLMHNGSGRQVWRIPSFSDGGDLRAHILAMPERLQFALLMTMWKMAEYTRRGALDEESAKWRKAFVQGRIRKSRPKQGRVYVTIEPEPEAEPA